jgi:hypothetical protein
MFGVRLLVHVLREMRVESERVKTSSVRFAQRDQKGENDGVRVRELERERLRVMELETLRGGS